MRKVFFVVYARNCGPKDDTDRILIAKLARNNMLSGNQILLQRHQGANSPIMRYGG